MRILIFCLLVMVASLFSGCDRNNNFSVIDPSEDVVLGKQLTQQLLQDPSQFPVLDQDRHPKSYQYLQNMVQEIIASGEVAYRDEFAWKVYIIKNDEVLNAFATPGGYIFVYTGLIKYLEREADLAGVLGHEIAHADLRHGTRQMQKAYGLNFVLNLLVGGEDQNVLGEIAAQLAGQLAGLKFSREYEEEADARSVDYLSNTTYPCNAVASFFEKLQEEEQEGRVPTFLSTHPQPENRIEKIRTRSKELGCEGQVEPSASYQAFQNSLP
jgi:predicted Zn-dependent protease